MTASLSRTGARRLAEAERTIEQGQAAFITVAAALNVIREERLYREQYETFEAYCQGRWKWTARRARQLMAAAEVGTIVPVENEGQARALAGLNATEAIEVFEAAQAAGPVTAATITKARQEIVGGASTRKGEEPGPGVTTPPTLTAEGDDGATSAASAPPPSVTRDPALKMHQHLSERRSDVAQWVSFDRHHEVIDRMSPEQRADYRSFVHSVWKHASDTLDYLDNGQRLKAVQ